MRFGLLLFTWGLFKKVVLADRLGIYVDTVYDDVHSYQGLPLILATYAYAFQIYFDFSGYTDMALGTARLFNINLTQNFNSPYLATSIADFWRRWHISFSRWILDYIFKPLQMQWRNARNWGTAAALLVTFTVSGLWHGANWGFIIWGLLHGIYLACSVFYKPYQKKIHKTLKLQKTKTLKVWQIFVTFHLVTFAWIFFRASSLADAGYLITNIFNDSNMGAQLLQFVFSHGRLNLLLSLIFMVVVILLAYLQMKEKKESVPGYVLGKPLVFRWFFYLAITMSIILFYSVSRSFIYNNF